MAQNAGAPLWRDRDGKPITMLEWAELHSDFDYVRVDHTEVEGITISTVWLGTCIGSRSDLFETMVFFRSSRLDDYVQRYPDLKSAIDGHSNVVEMVSLLEDLGDREDS